MIGVPWWLDDPDPSERTSDWATGQARYAGIMLGYAALALLGLRYFPPAWTTSPADVAASALLSPAWLCGSNPNPNPSPSPNPNPNPHPHPNPNPNPKQA